MNNTTKKKIRKKVPVSNRAPAPATDPMLVVGITKNKHRLRTVAYSPSDSSGAILANGALESASPNNTPLEDKSPSPPPEQQHSSLRLPRASSSLVASRPQAGLAIHCENGVISPRPSNSSQEKESLSQTGVTRLGTSCPSIPRLAKSMIITSPILGTEGSPRTRHLSASQRQTIIDNLLYDPLDAILATNHSKAHKMGDQMPSDKKVLFVSSTVVELGESVATEPTDVVGSTTFRQRVLFVASTVGDLGKSNATEPTDVVGSTTFRQRTGLRRTKSLVQALVAPAVCEEDAQQQKDYETEGTVEKIRRLDRSTSDEQQQVDTTILGRRDSASSDTVTTTTSSTASPPSSGGGGGGDSSTEDTRIFAIDGVSSRRKSMQFLKNMLMPASTTSIATTTNLINNGPLERVHSYSHSSDLKASSPRGNARSPRQVLQEAAKHKQYVARGNTLIIFNPHPAVGDKDIQLFLVPNSAIEPNKLTGPRMRLALQRAMKSGGEDPFRMCECRKRKNSLVTEKATEYCTEHADPDVNAKFPVAIMLDRQYLACAGAKVSSLLKQFNHDFPNMVPGEWATHRIDSMSSDFSEMRLTHVYQIRIFIC